MCGVRGVRGVVRGQVSVGRRGRAGAKRLLLQGRQRPRLYIKRNKKILFRSHLFLKLSNASFKEA